MKRLVFLIILFPCIVVGQISQTQTIACVGNSITYGYGLENPNQESYPAQLQGLLGTQNWIVENLGNSARTMLKTGNLPYWNEPQYTKALACNPNIVIIELGTNDSKRWIWNAHGSEFSKDYKEMIQSFRNLSSKPDIWMGLLIHGENVEWDIYNSYIQDSVNPKLLQIALDMGVGLIDLYNTVPFDTLLYMKDGVHPTKEGCTLLAQIINQYVTMPKPEIQNANGVLIAPEAYAYQWYCNSIPISAENNGTLKSIQAKEKGTYTVSIKINKENETRIVSKPLIVK